MQRSAIEGEKWQGSHEDRTFPNLVTRTSRKVHIYRVLQSDLNPIMVVIISTSKHRIHQKEMGIKKFILLPIFILRQLSSVNVHPRYSSLNEMFRCSGRCQLRRHSGTADCRIHRNGPAECCRSRGSCWDLRQLPQVVSAR